MILESLREMIGAAPAGLEWMEYFFAGGVMLVLLRCLVALFSGLLDFLFRRKK